METKPIDRDRFRSGVVAGSGLVLKGTPSNGASTNFQEEYHGGRAFQQGFIPSR